MQQCHTSLRVIKWTASQAACLLLFLVYTGNQLIPRRTTFSTHESYKYMTQEHKPQLPRENTEFAWASRHDAKKI